MITLVLQEETMLAERMRTLFTIASRGSILTSSEMAISTKVLTLAGGGENSLPPQHQVQRLPHIQLKMMVCWLTDDIPATMAASFSSSRCCSFDMAGLGCNGVADGNRFRSDQPSHRLLLLTRHIPRSLCIISILRGAVY